MGVLVVWEYYDIVDITIIISYRKNKRLCVYLGPSCRSLEEHTHLESEDFALFKKNSISDLCTG